MTSVVSNSVQPHRWQPTRLPCPWDSPGKNAGVGFHFLLQCMKVKSESEVTQSLSNSVSHQKVVILASSLTMAFSFSFFLFYFWHFIFHQQFYIVSINNIFSMNSKAFVELSKLYSGRCYVVTMCPLLFFLICAFT